MGKETEKSPYNDEYLHKAYAVARNVINQLYESKNHKLYAPTRFPSSKNPIAENFQKPGYFIYPNEAIAIRVLINEAFLLASKINPDNQTDPDIIDGLAEFGNKLGDAAGVRQGRIVNTEFSNTLKGSFEKDAHRTISQSTTDAILETIAKTTKLDIKSIDRIAKRMEGARLAQSIYLKVLLMDKTSK